jgi:hypothetical protein
MHAAPCTLRTSIGLGGVQMKRAVMLCCVMLVAAVHPAGAANAHHSPGYDNLLPNGRYPTSQYPCEGGPLEAGRLCQTDNNQLTAYRGTTLTQTARSNIYTALNSWYNPTDLDVIYETTAVTSGQAETDIMYGVTSSPWSSPRTWCAWRAPGDPVGAG